MSTAISNPAYESQAIFRAVMDAFAAPGRRLTAPAVDGPDGLAPAAAAILRSLADFETPVWLDPPFATQDVKQWLQFNTGAPLARDRTDAAFAVVSGDAPRLALDRFAAGSAEYPDRSATVIVQIAGLEGGPALTLAGPGIPGSRNIAPLGLRPGFTDELRENGALYPLGVDVLLAHGEGLIGLPRSTQVEEAR